VSDELVWIDCEMTGLDLERDALIEVATLVTDKDLNVLGEGVDVLIKPTDEQLAGMSDFVREMHTKSGLLDALAGGTTIASTQKSDDGQGSEDYQRVYANGPLYAPVTGYFSPAFASMTGMEKEGNSVLNGDDPSLFSSRIKTLITGDSQRGGAVELTIKPEIP